MKQREINAKIVYVCEECGFGYADAKTAERCEAWCSANKSCNLEITKNAVYKGD